ncbi:MAG: TolC family protein [Kofleriaceae bacterium]|nr:TolC family protein [Kofleriaceae bacterium]
MRRLVLAILLVVSGPRLAAAEKLTLDQVIAKAIANPRVQMAQEDVGTARARLGEADAGRWPKLKATGFATVSPEIRCIDPTCNVTEPQNFAFRFSGFFGSIQVDVTQPLYTFGKIDHARRAARAGVAAQKALADEAAGDAAADAARAYWGLKLARELGGMLDDGIEEITKAKSQFGERTDISIQDRQRVEVLLAEAKAQRAEAMQGELQALAGLRAITALPDADIDDDELAAVQRTLPNEHTLSQDVARRPQNVAAIAGVTATEQLAAFQRAYYYPDFALVGSAWGAKAQGVDDPPGAFANDPFNRFGAGLVLGLQWAFDPWTTKARVDRAEAEARKAKAQANLAAIGASYDIAMVTSEARAAKAKVDATLEGEKSARTWLASVLQSQAIGTAEPRDLADAYIAWFQMKARWAQAVFQWNVAVVRLGRAIGEYKAGS